MGHGFPVFKLLLFPRTLGCAALVWLMVLSAATRSGTLVLEMGRAWEILEPPMPKRVPPG